MELCSNIEQDRTTEKVRTGCVNGVVTIVSIIGMMLYRAVQIRAEQSRFADVELYRTVDNVEVGT